MGDYFLGILLPEDFAEEVEVLRRRFSAPRTAPHITLLPPFTWSGTDQQLFQILTNVVDACAPFTIKAQGLGRFGRRVIFVDVTVSPELANLHRQLAGSLAKHGLGDLTQGRPYHPHITLATRLTPTQFDQYLEELSDYSPSREFLCQFVAVFELKTNGRFRRWQVVNHIPLN